MATTPMTNNNDFLTDTALGEEQDRMMLVFTFETMRLIHADGPTDIPMEPDTDSTEALKAWLTAMYVASRLTAILDEAGTSEHDLATIRRTVAEYPLDAFSISGEFAELIQSHLAILQAGCHGVPFETFMPVKVSRPAEHWFAAILSADILAYTVSVRCGVDYNEVIDRMAGTHNQPTTQ